MMELEYSSSKVNARRKWFIPGAMFPPFSFINILSGKQHHHLPLDDDDGMQNLVEVAVTLRILQLLYKECALSKHKLSIAVLSPYPAQIQCIQQKLENGRLKNDKFFKVKVGSTHNYEGGGDQVDILIISTVGVSDECIHPNTSTNVYFTWARYLWILGDEKVHLNGSSGSIWESLIVDAKAHRCFFHADQHKDLAKVIVEVKKDLHQLDELLSGDTTLFQSSTWKVLFSSSFRSSFSEIESWETKKLVLLMLLKLSSGWRPKGSTSTAASIAESPYSQLMREVKVRGLHLICTIDIGKDTHYTQVLKVWDILLFHKIAELVKRLEGIIGMYTEEYIDYCKARCHAQRGWEYPMKWPGMSTIRQFKIQPNRSDDGTLIMDGANGNICVENANVKESLMLMKFYPLSCGAVNIMISGCDGEAIGLPFELTEQEKDVVSFDKSSFIVGRSGTGKTTVLTMKLFQNEQLHHLACEGFHEGIDRRNEEVKQDVLHQLFVTFSPKLCYAVRQQVNQWKRLTCGGSSSGSSVSIDNIDKMMFEDIPDHFIHLPHDTYPLIITFHKFLLMLDGTVGTSYFERFPCARKQGTSRLDFLEQNMRSMDVTYEKFCSRYWCHFNEKLTKNLDPSMVYTEIMSVIKAGLTTGDQTPNGILSGDDYVALCDGRTSILDAQKRQITYAIFLQYEMKKTENGDFDLADLVNDLHQRLEVEGYNGDPIDYVYIDEVQDLSMRQIALFKYVCRNVDEGFAFCGDTAQAIAKGIGFRFEDIRCMFFREFLLASKKGQISKILQLSENFRTHAGVLNLAQSVIDLLCHFFPLFVDRLSPETSRIRGELPILLETDMNNDAVKTIFGRNGDACQQFVGFGAEQAVLVRDERLKEKVVDMVGKKSLVLTIMESKGLEFQDVLLYDFFSTSSFSNEWRIIYEYMEENSQSSSFNMEKHNVLCSELKQLYVAITRTRQRLWICETSGFSQPMYDYWKKFRLVEVKRLNDSFADEMQIPSSKDEWKLRGVKLFCEKSYSMAEMCFFNAGDEYSARLAKAYHLRALADGPWVSQIGRKKCLKDAADLFGSCGKNELAAECFYEMDDFKSMMGCVASFFSKNEMRSFLTKKRCHAELILLEIKWGNFEEAVNVAKRKPDDVVQADLLCIGGLHRESSLIILWHLLSSSPIFQGMDGLINAEKSELLTKAVSIAKSDADVFDQLSAISTSPPASKVERKKLFKEAAKLFREIGKNELAAKCFYKIKDYTTAGDIYWRESMWEKAGKCFCRAKCYELAVEAYDKAGACAKCLLACSDGKLFETGIQLIGRWGGSCTGDAELEFYDNAASYYFDVKDSDSMMKCVRSFRSKDDMRLFLNRNRCLDELISLETEWGNFMEAAKVASLKPDPVLQADLLCMGGHYRESSLIILWHVFSNSPIFRSTEEPFEHKDELLTKAVSIAKSDIYSFSQFVRKEAEILAKGETREDLLKNGLEFIHWYKNNTLAVSLDALKKAYEIEKIEREVLDLLRSLFKSGNRLDELLLLEEVRGEFVEAANIVIEDDDSLEAALRRLWYVFFGSLWSRGKRAWPMKDFKQKDKLLDDAKSYLEDHPDSEESVLVRTEISVLSSVDIINLSQMWMYLREIPRDRSLRIQFLISRRILDVHLIQSGSEVYACTQICIENYGSINHLEGALFNGIVSVEGLIYIWNHWKGLMLDLINWCQVDKGSKIYDDFIFNYFGVRRYDRDPNGFHVLLDAEAQWVKQMNPVMIKKGYLFITPACKFPSVVSRYWCSELVFVAEKVLNKLNALHTYSTVKNFSMHQQTKILACLFEVATSLQKCKLPYYRDRAGRIVSRSLEPCVNKLLSNVFDLDWKNAQSKEMISMRGNETFQNMLEEAVNIKCKSWRDSTCGPMGTIAMIFLGSRIGFNDDIKRKVRACSSMNWRYLFDKLDRDGSHNGDLAVSLHNVLKESFCGDWRVDGCMSPSCFLYLMERLLILSFRYNSYVLTTRSSCVEWLANANANADEEWSMGSNGELDTMKNMYRSLASMVSEMLNSKDDLMEWLTRSKDSQTSSYAILVLRLTLLLALICANSGQCYYHLLDLLQCCHFVSFLPSGFREALITGLKEDCLIDAVGVACKEIDNPLVVMSFRNDLSESLCENAIFVEVTKMDLRREMVMEVLYP